MIGALIINNFCLILLVKGVPTWMQFVLSVTSAISSCAALIAWEETKSEILALEDKIKKKDGDVDSLDLINRQKETIEQLQTALFKCGEEAAEMQKNISQQKAEIETQKCVIRLLEEDIADRDKMLESKVEDVYVEFIRDYKAMREELEGCYEELATARAEAFKELAKSVKKHTLLMFSDYICGEKWRYAVPVEIIDETVKELSERRKPSEV